VYYGFGFLAIYVVLSLVFIADVVRQPATTLSGAGKTLWIFLLLSSRSSPGSDTGSGECVRAAGSDVSSTGRPGSSPRADAARG
jgi:hypothetical protein